MKKFLQILAVFWLVLLLATNLAAMEIRIDGEQLSISADSEPLQEILRQFALQGVAVRIDPELNPPVSARFSGRDLQAGLAAILQPYSFALRWERQGKGPEHGLRLAAIDVYRQGHIELIQPLGLENSHFDIVRHDDGYYYVRGELLLTLKPGIGLDRVGQLLAAWGATVVEGNQDLGIYRVRLPGDKDPLALLRELGNYPDIVLAEPNYAYPLPAFGAWELNRVATDGQLSKGRVPIAVLDSGLAPGAGLGQLVLASLDALEPAAPITDPQGHGTQMSLLASGIIRPHGVLGGQTGIAPIIPIRVFDAQGYTTNYSLIQAVDFAVANGARVMSLSWGSEVRSEFLNQALEYATGKNLVIVASAGNEPTGRQVYPAAYPSVIGVGALGWDGKPWKNSNFGDFVSLYAPGMVIIEEGQGAKPGTYGGTSVSTAYMANIIAGYLSENPGATRQELNLFLQQRQAP